MNTQAINIGYKYTDYTFNSNNWTSICEVVSKPFEDKYSQVMRVKVKMTFEGKNIEPKYSWVRLESISNYKKI
jgi:hypothetical protein